MEANDGTEQQPPPSKRAKVDSSDGVALIYEVELPVTQQGLLCNVQEEEGSGHWYFAGYIRKDNGKPGRAEKEGLIRNVGDRILKVGDFSLHKRTVGEIIEIHQSVCELGKKFVNVQIVERKNWAPPPGDGTAKAVTAAKATAAKVVVENDHSRDDAKMDKPTDQHPLVKTDVAPEKECTVTQKPGKNMGVSAGTSKMADSHTLKHTNVAGRTLEMADSHTLKHTDVTGGKRKTTASQPQVKESAKPTVQIANAAFSEAVSIQGIPFRITPNEDGSTRFCGYGRNYRSLYGKNKIIAVNGLSTTGIKFGGVIDMVKTFRDKKEKVTIRYVPSEPQPVTPNEASKKANRVETIGKQAETTKEEPKTTNGDQSTAKATIKDSVLDGAVESSNNFDRRHGLDLSSEDEAEDDDNLFDILYKVGACRKKVSQAQSRKAAGDLLALLSSATTGDESVWQEFENMGGINALLLFLKRNEDHFPSVKVALAMLGMSAKLDVEGAVKKFIQKDGIAMWCKAVEDLVVFASRNPGDDTPWLVLGEVWSAMSSITDGVTASKEISLTADVKEKIADTALMFLPDLAMMKFAKFSEGRKGLIGLLNCLSNLCCDSNRASLGFIRCHLAKKNFEQALCALVEPKDKDAVTESESFLENSEEIIDHCMYQMFSTLEGCDADRLATIDLEKVLAFCFKFMKRFQKSEEIQEHGFFAVQRALVTVSKTDGLKLGVVSNLAATILENEHLDSDDA
ncbi:MAG: hypothetical protein SGILL_003545, partial [Bacillariaceae sp.]